jgi:hypothetical protein
MRSPRSHSSRCRRCSTPVAEALESRRMLSGSLAGTFAGSMPAVLVAGQNEQVKLQISDIGNGRVSGGLEVSLYASTAPTIDGTATLLDQSQARVGIQPGKNAQVKLKFTSPASLAAGNDYLVAKVSSLANVADATTLASSQTVPAEQPFVDLTGEIISQSSVSFVTTRRAGAGHAKIEISNNGNVAARGPMQITLYASTDSAVDPSAIAVGVASFRNLNLGPGVSKSVNAQLRVPAGTTPANYVLLANINSAGTINESDMSNDLAIGPEPLAILDASTGSQHSSRNQSQDDGSDEGGSVLVITGDDEGDSSDGGASDNSAPVDNSANGSGNSTTSTAPTSAPSDGGGSSDSGDGSDFGGGDDSGGDDSGGDDSGGGADFAIRRL